MTVAACCFVVPRDGKLPHRMCRVGKLGQMIRCSQRSQVRTPLRGIHNYTNSKTRVPSCIPSHLLGVMFIETDAVILWWIRVNLHKVEVSLMKWQEEDSLCSLPFLSIWWKPRVVREACKRRWLQEVKILAVSANLIQAFIGVST